MKKSLLEMKKSIMVFLVFISLESLYAQEPNIDSLQKNKTENMFLWGLFKSKNYNQKMKDDKIKFGIPSFEFKNMVDTDLDTTMYKENSILWGTIKWTEKVTSKTKNND